MEDGTRVTCVKVVSLLDIGALIVSVEFHFVMGCKSNTFLYYLVAQITANGNFRSTVTETSGVDPCCQFVML